MEGDTLSRVEFPAFIPPQVAGSGGWSRTGTDVHLTNIGDEVGIGTATPSEKLHIGAGNIKLDDTQNIGWSSALNLNEDLINAGGGYLNFGGTDITKGITGPKGFEIYANTGTDFLGNWEPNIFLEATGEIRINNTTQGSAGARKLSINMTDGVVIEAVLFHINIEMFGALVPATEPAF